MDLQSCKLKHNILNKFMNLKIISSPKTYKNVISGEIWMKTVPLLVSVEVFSYL